MISAPVKAGVPHSVAAVCLRACVALACLLALPLGAGAQTWSEAWFRGTPNDWGTTAMTYDAAAGVWVTEQTFAGDNPRFKISHYQNWNEAYPGADYQVVSGRYRITFDDVSKAITVSEVVEPPPAGTSTSLCFDNAQNYTSPQIYFWNPAPGGSVNNLPGWPGAAMSESGAHYCYDFSAHLNNGEMPDSLNVIFNDNGGAQSADLQYSGDPCYIGNQWQPAAACGLDEEPGDDLPPSTRPLLVQPLNFPITGNVSGGNYRFEIAYPNLQGQFMSPVMVIPDGINDLLYVVDKTGTIFVFPNREDVAPGEIRELLNINGEVRNYHEQGLLSMAFDPGYASNGHIYIYYIHGTDDNERAPDGSYGDAILERWTLDNPNDPSQALASSRTEILRVPQRGPDHKGGMMQFHPEDNYLYLSIGDGAYGHSATMSYPEDPRTNNGAQETDNLLGTFIRIKPLEQAVNGKYYEIPADNPFVGVPGFREEIWSYGHRNPWRWSFDTEAPYTLWETEVGQAGFEEVNLIEKGKNYGWPVCEGTNNRGDLGGDPGKNCSTDFEPPRDGYAHPTGYSIIGGVVYRGNALPGLSGNFVFGDYVTKRIWSIVDGEAKELISDAFPENIASFGTDLSGDTLLVSTYGVEYGGQSTIYKIVDDDAEAAVIPAKLSETGLFADLETLEPVSGVIEYALNSEGWFDGAALRHFIAVPNDQQINFAETGKWDLPVGTVLVKHQSISTAENPHKPFTTSVLFRQDTGKWQAANYYWNSAGTDADLVTETLTVMDGGIENRQRAVQSAADCGSCHIGSGSREPLAVHTRQFNREFQYGETETSVANQLDVFNTIALLSEDIGSADSHAAFVNAADTSADLDERARTYLETNCAHCHASGFMDLRYDTPLADMRIVNVETTGGAARLRPFDHANSLVYIYQTTDNNRMPKGTRYTNPVAEALFRDWIDGAGLQQVGIQLDADSDRLNGGDALTVQVYSLYDNGFTAPVPNAPSVSSSNSDVLAVESVGDDHFVLRAGNTGSTSVTVQQGGFSSQLTIAVTSIDTAITGLEIAPQGQSLESSRQLVAVGIRADGTRENIFGQVGWSVASGPATIDQSGLVTRTGAGAVTVEANLGEFTASLNLAEGFDGIRLRYDNPDNWAQVYVHLWVTVDGQDQGLTQWPGLLMSGPDTEGWWTHSVDQQDLHNGQVNLVFNSGNGQQTGDQRNIGESSSFVGGAWEPWTPEGPVGGDTSRVSVIGGITADGGRDYAIGSVISVNADDAPLGTVFGGWSGDAAPYIVSDPSLPQVQLLIPQHDLSLVALFPSATNEYEAGQNFYAAQCANCHGDQGQGAVAQTLAGSGANWQLGELTQYIEDFMPMDAAASCTGDEAGACAFEVARLIVDEAWDSGSCSGSDCDGSNLDQRNLRLLTREEYLNSVRDIFAIDFDSSLMSSVPADGRYRNFDTASYLSADNDRTLGYEMVAEQVADLAIAQAGFMNLVSGCGDVPCVVDTLGFRLFRRPLQSAEITRYAGLYQSDDDGRLALQAMLMSPHFMYRSELGVLDSESGLYRLDNYEVATLLSYTFWATTPDDTLLLAATEAGFDIAVQVDRLLADPRAERGLRRFISGWLINNQYPFPAITDTDLVAAFKEETVGFVLENIRSNSAFGELLSANYTWANGDLAAHYGLDASGGDWAMRTFPAGDPRSGSGLLGHGSFLASRTSTVNPAPIKRGVYVREVLMCQEFPPPAAADFNVVFEDTDSNREATARHTSDPACAACHQFIDGVGFGFERFGSDALYRTIETIGTGEQREIDDSGSIKSLYTPATVMDPTSPSYDFYSVPELAGLIAGSDQGEACFARQFYRYVVGREEGASDDVIIHSTSEDLRNGGGMRDMLRALVLSDAFTLRR
ncbi:PQQ-dependent sugar dehydrogenase [Microbulbifer sp. HZ11]|uniref:PQQ-dependent sugar dehydrogenase n=1 Tax=Microbulbifer sp. HZ11 TaxID=1453501 RepID=UPI0005BC3BD4|nr:PQQ-dependent sugar dehydrogenase [Microbulbifer sp. HZ11]